MVTVTSGMDFMYKSADEDTADASECKDHRISTTTHGTGAESARRPYLAQCTHQ